MKNKTTRYLLLGSAVFGAAVLAIVTFSSKSAEMAKSNIGYADQISSIPTGTIATIEYLGARGGYSNKKTTKTEKITIHPADAITNITRQDQYSVSYHLQLSDNRYIDANLLINKKNKKLYARLSGINHGGQTSLIIDETILNKDIPVDWTGRIEFEHANIIYHDNSPVCLIVSISDHNQPPFSFCHTVGIAESEAS